MSTDRAGITGLLHTVVCVALGAVLVMLLGADGSANVVVPPSLDSAAQRLRMQEELTTLNGKMDELINLLKSGNVKVICVRADNDGRGPGHADGSRDKTNAPVADASREGGYGD